LTCLGFMTFGIFLIFCHIFLLLFTIFLVDFFILFMLGSVRKGIKAVPKSPADSDSTGIPQVQWVWTKAKKKVFMV
jgi:hypothetical protein